MSAFLYRLGHRCATKPKRVVLLWILAAVVMVFLNGAAGGKTEETFEVPGVESQQATDALKEKFPTASGALGRVVFHVDEGRIHDPANAEAVTAAVTEIADGDDVAGATNPFDPAAPAVSADGKTAFTNIQYTVDPVEIEHLDHVKESIEPTRDAGIQTEIGGNIASAEKKVEGNDKVGLLVAMIVLIIAFGSVVAAGVPIGTALIGIAVGLSGVGVMSAFTSVSEVAPMLAMMIGLGVGIDYALFIVTRHRQGLAEGKTPAESAAIANATAGQSVLFAGTTVVIAIVGLLIAGLPAVTTMGMAVAFVVIVSMLAAVTLLPAFLGWLGPRLNSWSIHRKHDNVTDGHKTVSGRWANHVGKNPWKYAIVSFLALGALTLPVLGMRIGMADDGNKAEGSTEREAYDLLADGFGPGFNGPFTVVVDVENSDNPQAAVASVSDALAADPGIAAVAPASFNEAGDTAIVLANPTTSPQDEATSETLDRIRSEVLPGAVDDSGVTAKVTGQTAMQEDVSKRISERLIMFIGAVVLLSFILLLVVFRSVLVPLKAAVMNLLSIGAAYGVIIAVFQWGWAKDLVGIEATIPINPFVPMIMFAILFGLSMDYEVFLLSRVREEYVSSKDSHKSVVDGLASTARVITSAAIIMISVFLAFVASDDVTIKMFGLGLAVAVFLDATLVRMVLVPSTMSLMGGANWWLPKWLDRILPHLDLEAAPEMGTATTEETSEEEEDELQAA
jgi:RND superfamily putative drug exporter